MNKLLTHTTKSIRWLLIVLLGGLFILNVLVTTMIIGFETPFILFDLSLDGLVGIVAAMTIVYFLRKKDVADKLSSPWLAAGIAALMIVLSLIWIFVSREEPMYDRKYISDAAIAFLHGDYTELEPGGYIERYPHQLGYLAILQILYTAFGEYYMVARIVNCLAIGIIALLVRQLSKELRPDHEVAGMGIIWTAGASFLMIWPTYVYGNVLGLMFATSALLYAIKYVKHDLKRYALYSVVLSSLACLCKMNYLIMLIAILLLFLYHALDKKRITSAVFAGLLLVCYFASSMGVQEYYERKSGIEFGKGIPMHCFVVMGMNDGFCGKGSFSGYTDKAYKECGYDPELTAEQAKEYLADRAQEFLDDPLMACTFYIEKGVFQWTEPTYMSLWESEKGDPKEWNSLEREVQKGTIRFFFDQWSDIWQTMTWFFAMVYFISKKNSLRFYQLVPGIYILGGFLFSLLWESKAQYILQYIVLAIPYAASGLLIATDWLQQRFLPWWKTFCDKYGGKNIEA